MKKQIHRYIAMMIAVLCVVVSTVHAESSEGMRSIASVLREFSAENMEAMADRLPNARIPYRGSNTIYSLNNTFTCRAIDGMFSVDGFVQVNNVFPIDWSDVFYIGMNTDALVEVLNSFADNDEQVVIVYANDGEVELITCLVESADENEKPFKIVFYTFDKQVYQIEFAFYE